MELEKKLGLDSRVARAKLVSSTDTSRSSSPQLSPSLSHRSSHSSPQTPSRPSQFIPSSHRSQNPPVFDSQSDSLHNLSQNYYDDYLSSKFPTSTHSALASSSETLNPRTHLQSPLSNSSSVLPQANSSQSISNDLSAKSAPSNSGITWVSGNASSTSRNRASPLISPRASRKVDVVTSQTSQPSQEPTNLTSSTDLLHGRSNANQSNMASQAEVSTSESTHANSVPLTDPNPNTTSQPHLNPVHIQVSGSSPENPHVLPLTELRPSNALPSLTASITQTPTSLDSVSPTNHTPDWSLRPEPIDPVGVMPY